MLSYLTKKTGWTIQHSVIMIYIPVHALSVLTVSSWFSWTKFDTSSCELRFIYNNVENKYFENDLWYYCVADNLVDFFILQIWEINIVWFVCPINILWLVISNILDINEGNLQYNAYMIMTFAGGL